MMRRTQLYIQEEIHDMLHRLAKTRGASLSETVREALKEFVEKPKVKRVLRKRAKTGTKNPFLDMAGIIKGGRNLASGVDEIYDQI